MIGAEVVKQVSEFQENYQSVFVMIECFIQ